jgi:uncharacterized protein (DUF2342 family)
MEVMVVMEGTGGPADWGELAEEVEMAGMARSLMIIKTAAQALDKARTAVMAVMEGWVETVVPEVMGGMVVMVEVFLFT